MKPTSYFIKSLKRRKSASKKLGENNISVAVEIREITVILNCWVLACTLSLSGNKYQIRKNKMTNVIYEVGG